MNAEFPLLRQKSSDKNHTRPRAATSKRKKSALRLGFRNLYRASFHNRQEAPGGIIVGGGGMLD